VGGFTSGLVVVAMLGGGSMGHVDEGFVAMVTVVLAGDTRMWTLLDRCALDGPLSRQPRGRAADG
jgi:hypothetical protein